MPNFDNHPIMIRNKPRPSFMDLLPVRAMVAAGFGASMLLASVPGHAAEGDEWIQLFNGKDLKDWTVKIRYHDAGDNFANTFRVEDGVMKVGYDGYDRFNETFGHIFYNGSFSNYVLRAEYRFTGEQVPGGPGWAFRNSGLMIHGQTPESMGKDQDFPDSIEVQLLGGRETGERSTANLCTPGTHVVMDGELVKRHCTGSASATYRGDRWVQVEIEVRGNQIIRHRVEGETVLEYTRPQLDDGTQLHGGTISLQSESHPVEFRKVELRQLREP